MDNLVYEDNPFRSSSWLEASGKYFFYWGQMYSVSIIIFTAGLYVLLTAFTQISQEAILFIIIGAALSFMVAIMPTKYQIFNDGIRIVHGWLFHFDIPFQNIENVTTAKWKDLWGLNLNFISGYSSDDILQIIRKRGVKIYISPRNRKLFVENLNKSLNDWKRNNIS